MSVYFIAVIHEIKDTAGMAEYGRLVVPTVVASTGKPVAAALRDDGNLGPLKERAGAVATIEGSLVAGISMIKFPDRQAFEHWYYSDAYQKALKVRQASANVQVVVVDGLEPM